MLSIDRERLLHLVLPSMADSEAVRFYARVVEQYHHPSSDGDSRMLEALEQVRAQPWNAAMDHAVE